MSNKKPPSSGKSKSWKISRPQGKDSKNRGQVSSNTKATAVPTSAKPKDPKPPSK